MYLPPLDAYASKWLARPDQTQVLEVKPNYILFSSNYGIDRFAPGSDEHQLMTDLLNGTLGYELVFAHRGLPVFSLLSEQGEFSNLDKVNPEIRVFQQAGEIGKTRDEVDPTIA